MRRPVSKSQGAAIRVAKQAPRKRRKRVLVALPFSHISQRKLCGIFRYADETDNWELHILPNDVALTPEEFRKLAENGIDGVIVSSGGIDAALFEIAREGVPIALIEQDRFQRKSDVVYIRIDESSIGGTAALFYLRDARWRTFGYVHTRSNGAWDIGRAKAFKDMLERHGAVCSEFPAALGADSSDAALSKWLKSLPKPVALFAAEDYRAHDVLNACIDCGLRVPQDVAIMGVGNTEAICDNSVPPLSTVEPDYELYGYLAAKHLDRIMTAKRPMKPEEVLCGVRRVVVRESTPNTRRKAGLLVQKALSYIRENARRGITVRDVISHLRVSRTLAVTGFREVLGTTILRTIHDIRLEQTRKALKETGDTIAEVCSRCGWKSENNPKRLFRAKYGKSMREFRNG